MIPTDRYRYALDSGVYLPGVDASDPQGRMPVELAVGKAKRPAVFLIIGQSNAANHGQGLFAAGPGVYNFNLFDGLCYPAADPLLGATGTLASPWCIVADALIAAGFADEIILVPLAVGGASVAEWAPGGPYHHRMMFALQRLGALGLKPTHVLWHQGEADALNGTTGADYQSRFRQLSAALRARGVDGPIYVAIASYFAVPAGCEAQQHVIRAAQRGLIDPASGLLGGPDTDPIRDRYDGCHMGYAGLRAHAAAWVRALTAGGKS